MTSPVFLDHCFGHDNNPKVVSFSESKHLAFYHSDQKSISGNFLIGRDLFGHVLTIFSY